eukprot:1608095-Rhodomonas_salina.1
MKREEQRKREGRRGGGRKEGGRGILRKRKSLSLVRALWLVESWGLAAARANTPASIIPDLSPRHARGLSGQQVWRERREHSKIEDSV